MPYNTKPGVDWTDIRERYYKEVTRGKISVSRLARETGVSRQAIQSKAKRFAWGDAKPVPHQPRPPKPYESRKKGVKFSKDTPEARGQILELLKLGMPLKGAAMAAGVTPATLAQWRKKDERFARDVDEARTRTATKALKAVSNAIESNDASTARWWLERDPVTRDDMRSSESGGGAGKIEIEINIPLPGTIETASIIDVTPKAKVIEHDEGDDDIE